MRFITSLLLCLATATSASAQDTPTDGAADGGEPTPPATATDVEDDDYDHSIFVYDDLFARWDGTRWFVATEVTVPDPVLFQARNNFEFRSTKYQVRTIIACEKDWRRSRRRFEVDCTIEDFGMQSIAMDRDNPARVQQILDEIDTALTGSYLQLSVRDDGRVVGIDLEGPTKRNNREDVIHETLRLVMSRVIVGYDMRLRKFKDLSEGVWVEYNSSLMSIPSIDASSRGTSTLVHKLEMVEGHATVESRGRGLIATGNDTVFGMFDTDYSGVAVYDRVEGFMTERVWALRGVPTASSTFSTFGEGNEYSHVGRLRIIQDENEVPEVGPTRQCSPPGVQHALLPAWRPLEQ
jgi:hypothetical protein